MTELEERPTNKEPGTDGNYAVIVYDNSINTFDEVINVLMVSTQCSAEEAMMETWEIHNLGQSTVHISNKEECDKIALIISSIGIKVEVVKDLE